MSFLHRYFKNLPPPLYEYSYVLPRNLRGLCTAKQTLEGVLQKFDLLNQTGSLITDDGAENKGALTKWLASSAILWKKIIAQVDIAQSNSMVEAANKILK